MSFQGADPEQVREATARLRALADRLETTTATLTREVHRSCDWTGLDGERFRAEWSTVSSKQLTTTVAALREGADTLWRNAAEQDQVSSVGGGTMPTECSTANPATTPADAGTLYSRIRDNGAPDGLYVEKVIGPDGETRFIVYFNGTDSAPRLNAARNAAVLAGMVDSKITDQIDAALREAGYQPGTNGPQMMLVGFSQGGMDAQNIAAAGKYNVTNLITYGSPLSKADLDGIDTVHLRAKGDNVPNMPAELLAAAKRDPVSLALIRADVVNGPGDRVPFLDPLSGESKNIYEFDTRTGGDPIFGNHNTAGTYESVGASFEGDGSDRAVKARTSMSKFEGDVAKTWRPNVG